MELIVVREHRWVYACEGWHDRVGPLSDLSSAEGMMVVLAMVRIFDRIIGGLCAYERRRGTRRALAANVVPRPGH